MRGRLRGRYIPVELVAFGVGPRCTAKRRHCFDSDVSRICPAVEAAFAKPSGSAPRSAKQH